MRKMSLLVGAGIGYVLGTRAGREKYDRMAAQVQRLRRDPRVKDKAQQARRAADDLGHKAGEKVTEAVERTGSSSDGSGDDPFPTSAPPGGTGA
ncbi:YtxH domain-containing protein [Janibacter cremeus]|uniref:YtxH domain-containing protein n=1 Tax=Janibacter cremeus TaxID=1285192 RepID=A0A852VKY0_9MICO|nr:YtxH domain-containing protein [Janibacter cremeus]NYF96716.1 hypothetical protein [Janibacter cremeus]